MSKPKHLNLGDWTTEQLLDWRPSGWVGELNQRAKGRRQWSSFLRKRFASNVVPIRAAPEPKRPQAPFPYMEFRTDDEYDIGAEVRRNLEYYEAIEAEVGWPHYGEGTRARHVRMRTGASYGSLSLGDRNILHAVRAVTKDFYNKDNMTVTKVKKARAERRRDRQHSRH